MAIELNKRSAALLAGAFLLGVALTAVVAALLPGDEAVPAPPVAQAAPVSDSIVIATGGVTGVYYPAGGAICRAFNGRRAEHGVRCTVESTGGSQANIAALRQGDVHLGVAQSDWHFHAYNGTSAFANAGKFDGLRSVFSLYTEPLTVVVRQDSDIVNLESLRGVRVDLGRPGTTVRATMELLISALGWEADDLVTAAPVAFGEEVAALCAGQVDAVVLATGHPNGSVMGITSGCEARLVEIAGPAVDAVIAENPYFARSVIPGGLYPGNLDDVATFGVGATVLGVEGLPEDVVYDLVRSVFEDFGGFARQHPVFGGLAPETMTRAMLTAPLHPGAERYYREQGWL